MGETNWNILPFQYYKKREKNLLTRPKNMKIIPIARFSSEIPQPQHFWIFFYPHPICYFLPIACTLSYAKFRMIYLWYLRTYLNSKIIQVNFNKAILSTLSLIIFSSCCWSRCSILMSPPLSTEFMRLLLNLIHPIYFKGWSLPPAPAVTAEDDERYRSSCRRQSFSLLPTKKNIITSPHRSF